MRDLINLVEDKRRRYRMGSCDAMALAIHEVTGLPLGVFRGYFPDDQGEEGDEAYETCHAVAVLDWDLPIWIDVDGRHKGMPENCVISVPGSDIRLEMIFPDDLRYEFSMSGVTDAEIDAARAFIAADPQMMSMLKNVVAGFSSPRDESLLEAEVVVGDEKIVLREVFDNPLDLHYDHTRSEEFKEKLPGVSSVFVYRATLSGQRLEFSLFRFRQAWEVHFNNASQDYQHGVVGVFKGAAMSQIIATVIHLYETKVAKGNPIRYYGPTPEFQRLYDLAFKHLNKTRFADKLMRFTDKSFRNPWGQNVQAVLVQQDTRTLPMKNQKIDEAIARWSEVL
jgi:hypothetical protein